MFNLKNKFIPIKDNRYDIYTSQFGFVFGRDSFYVSAIENEDEKGKYWRGGSYSDRGYLTE
jgi:hypothetical protein